MMPLRQCLNVLTDACAKLAVAPRALRAPRQTFLSGAVHAMRRKNSLTQATKSIA